MADQKPKIVLIAGAAVMVLTSTLVFILAAPSDQPIAAQPPAAPATLPPPAPMPTPAAAPAPAEPSTRAATKQGSSGARPSPAQRMSRDLKREQIWQALGQAHALEPAAPGSAAPAPEQRAGLPALDPQYIQDAIQDQLVPVAIECYESALEDDPELAGELLVEFTIVGAEEVGGVVEDARIQDESSLDSAFVRECIRESVMAVSFEPPADGGQVQVTYPMRFEPE